MYIWMVLATFIVVLAAYNLSPRADLMSQQQTPMAEAAITKFLVQHDAAVKYAKAKYEEYYKNPETGGNAPGIIDGCKKEKTVDVDEEGNEVEKETITGDLCKFLPIGYKYEENTYYSTIYCLNASEYEPVTDEETGEVTLNQTVVAGQTQDAEFCNNPEQHAVYLVTYGRIPERWKNVSTRRVLAEFYNAMHKKVAIGSSCGIVVPKTTTDPERNKLDSDFIIQGIDVRDESIPSYIYKHDETFKSQCLQGNSVNPSFPCIIYVTSL